MEETASLLASREPISYKWLHVIPKPKLGTCLDDTTVRIGVGLRLHADLCKPHSCNLCHAWVSSKGTHGLHCALSKGRQPRHHQLNNELKTTLASLQIAAIREPSGTHPNTSLRPDGATIVPWKNGCFLAWDVTVADTFAPSYLAGTSKQAGAAAETLERLKRNKYLGIHPQYEFRAIGLETMGPIGKSAQTVFEEICKEFAKRNQTQKYTFFQQRVSLILVRQNATSVLGSLPLDFSAHSPLSGMLL